MIDKTQPKSKAVDDLKRHALTVKRQALDGSLGPIASNATAANVAAAIDDVDRESILLNAKRQADAK
jgi:hypothetical protein